jgi:hypothetical protein
VEGGGGDAVGGERGQQQRHRPADQQQLQKVPERVAAGGGRGADDDDAPSPPLRVDRDREQARLVPQARERAAVEEDRRSQRPAQLGRGEQIAAAHRRGGIGDAPVGVEHLREALGRGDQTARALAQARVGLPDQGGHVAGPRAQPRVDRGVELGAEAQVDEDAGGAEHQRHHGGEDEGDAEANREVAQRPPSFRSR